MHKLSEEIFESCTIENCASNELVALPKEGDVGFREYFNLKAGMVYERKSLFSPRECNELILRYPGPEAGDRIFSLFFESPNVVARNNAFEGCFAIDITEYLHHTDSEAFRSLMSYVIDHEETVFLFFLPSDKPEDCERMFNAITAYTDVEYRRIPLPEAKVLARYSADKIRDFRLHLENGVESMLESFYMDHPCGYDAADFYVRYLKSMRYEGDAASLGPLLEKALRASGNEMRSSAIGFAREL